MKYLLDSNSYIQAKNFHYHMDFCPAFWSWLELQFMLGVVGSVEMIGQELRAGDDELAAWVNDRPHHFVPNDDAQTQEYAGQIIEKVMAGNYNHANRDLFLGKADPWLIAKAKTLGATVVTHEKLVIDPKNKKVKIPNICKEFGVPCIDIYDLLRVLKAQFVLA